MRKYIILFMFFAACVVLVGCTGVEIDVELDFKSVRDTETGRIISLGDAKAKIE